jgi:4-hydroxybenzoate polyprenyltransferase
MSGDPQTNFTQRIAGFARLAHFGDMLLAFGGAALSARLAGGGSFLAVARGAAAIALVVGGAFANDEWLRRAEYAATRPFNPLAQQFVKEGEAKWFSVMLLALGVALAVTLGWRSGVAAFALGAVLLSCNYFLMGLPGGANGRAAFAAGLPLAFGAAGLGGAWGPIVAPAVGAALVAGGASLFVDVENAEATASVGRRSPGRLAGGKLALVLGGIAAVAGVACFGWPFRPGVYAPAYWTALAAAAALMVIYMVLNLRRAEPDASFAGSTARLFKILLAAALAARFVDTVL